MTSADSLRKGFLEQLQQSPLQQTSHHISEWGQNLHPLTLKETGTKAVWWMMKHVTDNSDVSCLTHLSVPWLSTNPVRKFGEKAPENRWQFTAEDIYQLFIVITRVASSKANIKLGFCLFTFNMSVHCCVLPRLNRICYFSFPPFVNRNTF